MRVAALRQVVAESRPIGETLKNFAVVYFGNDWTAENRTSSHHVAERLARYAPVLYVECPGLRAPKASGRDFRKLYRKLSRAAQRPQQIGDQMWRITMPQIPFRRWAFADAANFRFGRAIVQRATKHLGFGPSLSWFAVPHPAALAGTLQETAVIYYCIDDYAALPDVDAAVIGRMDAALSKRADLLFVSSQKLLMAKRTENASAVHAPHGVDLALFAGAMSPTVSIPEVARRLPRPVIGFYGLIEAWIDLDLIAFLAERRPNWTFLMIGRLAVDPGRVRSLPNVVFPGPQPYSALPGWAKAFDVAIVPYRLTRQVINSSPLKVREYLATGKPVVSVSTPEIDRFAEHVRIAKSPEAFLHEIEDAIANDSPADRSRRIHAVAEMGWDARVGDAVRVVEDMIHRKAAQR